MITTCTDGKRCPRHLANGGAPSDCDPCGALSEEHVRIEQEMATEALRSPGQSDGFRIAQRQRLALAEQLLAREQELAETERHLIAADLERVALRTEVSRVERTARRLLDCQDAYAKRDAALGEMLGAAASESTEQAAQRVVQERDDLVHAAREVSIAFQGYSGCGSSSLDALDRVLARLGK